MTKRGDIESHLKNLLQAVLLDEHGDTAIVHRTFNGELVEPSLAVPSWPEPADPLQAIEIAGYIERVAGGLVNRYAEAARGQGRTWRELAAVLDVDPESDDPAYEAFRLVAGRPSQPYDEVYAYWRCGSCREYVRDLGPYGGHPEDTERGHAATCERFTAAVAAYESELD